MDNEVGFIGLGLMGLPIAANLLAAGIRLRVWNRTASKAEPLIARGARLVERAAEAARPGGILVNDRQRRCGG